MKKKTGLYLIVCLMLVSLIIAACGDRAKTNLPVGKFIKTGTTDYGLILKEDGTFSVFSGESEFVKGTYSVKGDIYTDESNDQNCPPMSFKFTFDGTNLTFKYVGNPADDPCGGRRGDFNNVTYVLSK